MSPYKIRRSYNDFCIANNHLVKNVENLANAKYIPGEKVDMKFTDVSPYAHVKQIPTLLFHGDQDNLVPDDHSKFLFKVLKEKKVISQFIPLAGKGDDCGVNQRDSENMILDKITGWVKNFN